MKEKTVWQMFFLLVLLNIFDVLSTQLILANGGQEVNNFLRYLMEHIGLGWGLVLLKITLLPILGITLFLHRALVNHSSTKRSIITMSVIDFLVVFLTFVYSCLMGYHFYLLGIFYLQV